MAEIGKMILNILGVPSFIIGVIVNWGNIISILMGIAGLIYAVYMILHAHENLIDKKLARKEKYKNPK